MSIMATAAAGGAGAGIAFSSLEISGDPLSKEMKKALFTYLEKNCFPLIRAWSERNPSVTWKQLKGKDDLFRAIEISLSSTADKKAFAIFQETLRSPSHAADLGLIPSSKPQEVAARIFMRTVLKLEFQSNTPTSLELADAAYKVRISGINLNSPSPVVTSALSPKYRLLMENDPVIAELKSSATPVDILLSRTYFLTDPTKTREETRIAIRESFISLHENPETRHVIEALACIIQTQKGSIFIGDSPEKTGSVGSAYTPLDAAAGFCRSHTIFCSSLSSSDKALRTRAKSYFIHEALHFIFGNIVNYKHSPTLAGSEEERLLDEALAKDREYRGALVVDNTISMLWTFMKSDLEECPGYFPEGFDPTNPHDLHIMRVESIVRVTEALTLGEDRERVRAAAPHLFDFYMGYSKPMIEAFVAGHALPSRPLSPTFLDHLAKLFSFVST